MSRVKKVLKVKKNVQNVFVLEKKMDVDTLFVQNYTIFSLKIKHSRDEINY